MTIFKNLTLFSFPYLDYRVGSALSVWSKTHSFKTLPAGNNWLPRLAIYGDLGFQNEESLPYLSKEVEKDMYDTVFHIGDLAYDLHERDGEQGNDFMRSIEKVASKVPYMTCPGNHEHAGNFRLETNKVFCCKKYSFFNNFSHYDARFSMLGDRGHQLNNSGHHAALLSSRINNHFHSMDIGPAHIILFSTEYYFYLLYGWKQIVRQYDWLEADLKKANENRAQRPWIIVMGHRFALK